MNVDLLFETVQAKFRIHFIRSIFYIYSHLPNLCHMLDYHIQNRSPDASTIIAVFTILIEEKLMLNLHMDGSIWSLTEPNLSNIT